MSTAPGMLPHEQGGASLRAGFYFDESKSMATVRASPATPLRCPAAGGLCGSTVEGPGAPRCERWGSPEAWRPATHAGGERGWDKLEFQEASCPVSTGGGTRRVQSVREGGGGGGAGRRRRGAAPRGGPRARPTQRRARGRGAGRIGLAAWARPGCASQATRSRRRSSRTRLGRTHKEGRRHKEGSAQRAPCRRWSRIWRICAACGQGARRIPCPGTLRARRCVLAGFRAIRPCSARTGKRQKRRKQRHRSECWSWRRRCFGSRSWRSMKRAGSGVCSPGAPGLSIGLVSG